MTATASQKTEKKEAQEPLPPGKHGTRSVLSNLRILIYLMALTGLTGLFGGWEIHKIGTLHKLNYLHVKYNQMLVQDLEVFRKGAEPINQMRRDVQLIREQPIACLEIIGMVEKVVLSAFQILRAVQVCHDDLKLTTEVLSTLDAYEAGRLSRPALIDILEQAVVQITNHSLQFEPLVEDAENAVLKTTITLLILMALVIPIVGIFVSRAVSNDCQELVRTQKRLIKARKEADEANLAKSKFLAHMSHELRTPLNAIIGFSDLMALEIYGKLGDSRYRSYATHIRESGKHLLHIINDLLDLSKVEAGKMELQLKRTEIKPLIKDALELVALETKQNSPTVHIALPTHPPRLLVDERLVKQALVNLISNAVKFTPDTGEVRIKGSLTKDGRFLLDISDNGVGMTESELAICKRPFGQIHNHVRDDQHGTGLGLPLVNLFMRLHDGQLEISSQKGKGTKVRLIFPACCVLTAQEMAAQTLATQARTTQTAPTQIDRRVI
ncbi:hypothetical protein GCM10007972_05620 [Iodidimonas muriae]|uniref:histidine kinase n=1 Tax=Iodidimonas muriae TaxID=261467 RepID=A0ABQ2L8Q2_9PROT|nr:ATP-binding protein [Iodidimonas muriae]GER05789.1 hypothetical protein JCM17843_00990 [Kordiimonadales bacterium JCM 17843]GGO06898.1 hypothetical protein GCM10007972_05620 [Iodidimonas muriae]